MRARALLLLALAAVAALAFFLLRGGDDETAPVLPVQPPPVLASDIGENAAAPPSTERVDDTPAQVTVEDSPAPDPPAPSVEERPEVVTVTGAAVRVDPDGSEHAGDDGSFEAGWRHYGEPVRHEVTVTGGRFAFDMPPGEVLYASKLVLGDVAVELDERSFVVPPDSFLLLRGTGLAAVTLRVLAEEDRSELADVELYAGGSYMHQRAHGHPGVHPDGEPLVSGAQSPITVRPPTKIRNGKICYWVRAPGRAWAAVNLDHSAGGEREVLLPLAGELEAVLVGNAAWLEPKVRLWPPGAKRWDAYAYAERDPDPDDRAVFESLAPGTYVVSVERGWAQDRTSYGKATVDVREGVHEEVRIEVDLPPEPVRATAAGTLHLPRAWSRRNVKLAFAGQQATAKWADEERTVTLEEMESLDAEGEVFGWRIELPAAGWYELELEPIGLRQFLDVPEEGLDDVRVEVPEPADARVRVVDDTTGEEIVVDRLHWGPPTIEEVTATPLFPAARNEALGCIPFRAPAGLVRIFPVGMSLDPVEDGPLELVPGPNEIELRVTRRIGVRFEFRDGDSSVPWSWSWRLAAFRTDGEARDVARSIGMLWFREEGAYELRAQSGIPGYRPLDGITFDVRAPGPGEPEQVVVVELERL